MAKARGIGAELKVAITARLRAMKKTQAWLAGQIGVDFSTLRTHLHHNKYHEEEVKRIARVLEMPSPGSPKWNYSFGRLRETAEAPSKPAMESIFTSMDKMTYAMKRSCDRIRDTYLQALREMGKDSVKLVFSATLTPMDMTQSESGVAVRAAVAAGIKQGGTFAFFRPDKSTLDKFTNDFSLRSVDPFPVQQHLFEEMQNDLISNLATEVGRDNARAMVNKHTLAVYPKRCPFWSPGVSFGLLRSFDESGHARSRVSIRIPNDSVGGSVEAVFFCGHHDLMASRIISSARAILVDATRPPGQAGAYIREPFEGGSKETSLRVLELLRDRLIRPR